MFIFRERPISIMILYAVALHWIWAILILFDEAAIGGTALASLHRWFSTPTLIPVLLIAATLALVSVFSRKSLTMVLLLIPQQFLLLVSAVGVTDAIWLSQFADGVIRDRAFIAADQLPALLAATGHTCALIAHALTRDRS